MEKVTLIFRKEFVGFILTIGAMILTGIALRAYIHDSKLDPTAMSLLIAPIGAGGLLFYGIRTTEGYLNNKLSESTAPKQQYEQTTRITEHVGN